jgi:hypothetical protein
MAEAYQEATRYVAAPPKDEPKKTFDQAFLDALAAKRPEPAGPLAETILKVRATNPAQAFDKVYEDALDLQLAELRGQFDGAFQRALKGEIPGETLTKITPDDKRRAIAYLLFHLIENQPGQEPNQSADLLNNPAFKRFVTVVGLEKAKTAVSEQAQMLYRIGNELGLARQRERDAFAVAHQDLLHELEGRAVHLEEEKTQLRRLEAQVADQGQAVAKRKRDVKQYEDELGQARAETDKQLKKLQGMTQALHEVRVQVRDALAKNAQYERDLRELEAGR